MEKIKVSSNFLILENNKLNEINGGWVPVVRWIVTRGIASSLYGTKKVEAPGHYYPEYGDFSAGERA